MSEPESAWIRFDQVDIDLAGRRLRVAGVDAPLEPKAFGVLCLLARQPGRAFTREEILDAVWGHRHVTPGVLNRAVTLIRQALGESAGSSQYLHTLHGVGYRLDADVQVGTSRPAYDAASTRALDNQRDAPREDAVPLAEVHAVEAVTVVARDSVPPVAADAPYSARPQPEAIEATLASPTRPAQRSRIAKAAWLVLLAALLAIFAAALWLPRRPPAPTAGAAPTLVVLPLQSSGAASGQVELADGLSEELITRLARIKGLHLISRTSSTRAQDAHLDLDQLGERLHATHALEGSLRQSEDQLRIDLRLIEIPGGRTLWAQDYDRKLADVFLIEREIAQSVAQALTLKLAPLNMSDAGDAQSFRQYLELRHRMWDPKALNAHAEVVEQLRAFVARVPEYARAHGLLARAMTQDLRPVAIPETEREEAAREAARALELDPDQVDAHAALGSIACRVQDWQRCMDEYGRALQLDPTDSVLRASHAAWLAAIGYVEEASQQVETGLASDPLNYESSVLRGWFIDLTGRHEEARRWLDATDSTQLSLRWCNAVWRHDYAGALALAQSRMPADDKFRDSYIAASEALLDPSRWPQAMPRVEGTFAMLLAPDADHTASMRLVERVWLSRTTPLALMFWSPDFVALRASPAFEDFLRRRHIIDYWRSRGWPPQCRAEGEHARCS